MKLGESAIKTRIIRYAIDVIECHETKKLGESLYPCQGCLKDLAHMVKLLKLKPTQAGE